MTDAEEFIEVFKPHTGQYVEKNPSNGYKLKRKELTADIVEAHLRGERTISFFARVTRNVIGMDVDDHTRGGWVGEEPTEVLRAKYREVMRIMGVKPSGVFRSDHGVHVYWLLATSVPDRVLVDGLKKKFGELLTDEYMRIAEVLPTNRAALKIPRPKRYMDTDLKEARFPGYRALPVYAVSEIFGDELTPDSLRYQRASRARPACAARGGRAATEAERKKPTRAAAEVGEAVTEIDNAAVEAVEEERVTLTLADVEKVERECGQFRNGQGNPQYMRLVQAYRRAGVSQSEAVDRIKRILAASPGYVGDIRTGVEARVAASYRRLKGPAEGIGLESAALRRDRHAMAFISAVIDELGMKNQQERAATERFLLKLWAWKKYLDGVMKRPEEAWAWDYENPRFRKMMSEGWYPLPSKLLRSWRHDYNKITSGLKALGVIVESPYKYSTDLRYCKHYALNVRRMQRVGGEIALAGTLTITRVVTAE
jgi:Uncharacterized protein conserved in bacteria